MCQRMKDELRQVNIEFVDVSCDDDPGLCDQLEKITGSTKYPMLVVKDLTQNLDYIYFTSFDYNELGKENIVDHKVRTVAFFSPEEVLKKINT